MPPLDPGTVVAKLRLPLPADGSALDVIGHLERLYGTRLTWRSDVAVYEDGWLIIATPAAAP